MSFLGKTMHCLSAVILGHMLGMMTGTRIALKEGPDEESTSPGKPIISRRRNQGGYKCRRRSASPTDGTNPDYGDTPAGYECMQNVIKRHLHREKKPGEGEYYDDVSQTYGSTDGSRVPWTCTGNRVKSSARRIDFKRVAKSGDFEFVVIGSKRGSNDNKPAFGSLADQRASWFFSPRRRSRRSRQSKPAVGSQSVRPIPEIPILGRRRKTEPAGGVLQRQGFKFIGAQAYGNPYTTGKIELWVRKVTQSTKKIVTVCEDCPKNVKGGGLGWAVLTIDGSAVDLDLNSINTNAWSAKLNVQSLPKGQDPKGRNDNFTMRVNKAKYSDGLNILAVQFDKNMIVSNPYGGEIAMEKVNYGSSGGVSLVVYQPDQPLPSSVELDQISGTRGFGLFSAMTVNMDAKVKR